MYHGCDYAVPVPEPKHLWKHALIKRKMCGGYVPKGSRNEQTTGKRQVLYIRQNREAQATIF